MDKNDLIQKCSRAMLESGPDVKVSLDVPADAGTVSLNGATMRLKLGGLRAVVKGTSLIDDRAMVKVHVKAAELLKALQ